MNKVQKRVFFGYDRNALGKFIIWEEQAEVVRYIFATYACGHSLTFIANELKALNIPSPNNKPIWGRQIINNILKNEKYLGTEDYPKIVEDEIFEQVGRIKLGNAYSVRYHGLGEGMNQLQTKKLKNMLTNPIEQGVIQIVDDIMTRQFVMLPGFDKNWASMGLNDNDLRILQEELLFDPQKGDVMQGTGGLRKLRLAFDVQGKS